MEKHPCSGEVHEMWSSRSCSRNGTIERDGKFWCRQHDPAAVAAKSQARRDRLAARARAELAAESSADAEARRLTTKFGVAVRSEPKRDLNFTTTGYRLVLDDYFFSVEAP